jgi:hypothetical protein
VNTRENLDQPHTTFLAGTEIGPNQGGGISSLPAARKRKEFIFQYGCSAGVGTAARFMVTIRSSGQPTRRIKGTCKARSGRVTVGYLVERHAPTNGASWLVTGGHGHSFLAMNVYGSSLSGPVPESADL